MESGKTSLHILSRLRCIFAILLLVVAGGVGPVVQAAEAITCVEHLGGIEHEIPGHDGSHIDSSGGVPPGKAVLRDYRASSGQIVGIPADAGVATPHAVLVRVATIPDDLTLARAAKPDLPPPRA